MPTTLTCYGGVKEIGGNKILLEDGDTRLFFDFGIAFGRQERFFNEFLRPRAARGLLDLLALGLIPPLEGLYRDDLALPSLWPRFRSHAQYRSLARSDGRPAVDGILVSHAHLDHNGDLPYIDPRIPVSCTRAAAAIARVMQITGQSSFERELTYINPRVCSTTGNLVSDRKSAYLARAHAFLDGPLSADASAFWAWSPSRKGLEPAPACPAEQSIGNLRIRWWPVDHSIPGAAGFAVLTTAGWIGYTGDIRFHGQYGERTRRFAQELAALEPVALLCEGTHIGSERTLNERDVTANALDLARRAPGRLMVADFAPRNVERLLSFVQVAREADRLLVGQPKDIYLLEALHLVDPNAFPNPSTIDCLAMYADPKVAPRVWERELCQEWAPRTVSAENVSRAPGAHLLAFSLWDANDLLDIESTQGGDYMYSGSRAYDDEQAADLDRLRNWIRQAGMTLHGDPDDPNRIPLHASGHAPGPQLVEFVNTVRPGRLIPIHTEEPEWWFDQLDGTDITVTPPEFGEPIILA